MNIGEVSKQLGISSSNIRYYEQIELIKPKRNKKNDYRIYGTQDIERLQEIKLLRKLDVPIQDIKEVFENEMTFESCMEKTIKKIEEADKDLAIRKKLCKELKLENQSLGSVDTNLYLDKVDKYEKEGVKFMSLANDFIEKIKDHIPNDSKYWFDPKEPILTKEQFTNELYFFAQEEGLDLQVLKESMNPKVMINGKRYVAVLETPRMFKFPFSFFFAPHTYGYMAVYLYEQDEKE